MRKIQRNDAPAVSLQRLARDGGYRLHGIDRNGRAAMRGYIDQKAVCRLGADSASDCKIEISTFTDLPDDLRDKVMAIEKIRISSG